MGVATAPGQSLWTPSVIVHGAGGVKRRYLSQEPECKHRQEQRRHALDGDSLSDVPEAGGNDCHHGGAARWRPTT